MREVRERVKNLTPLTPSSLRYAGQVREVPSPKGEGKEISRTDAIARLTRLRGNEREFYFFGMSFGTIKEGFGTDF